MIRRLSMMMCSKEIMKISSYGLLLLFFSATGCGSGENSTNGKNVQAETSQDSTASVPVKKKNIVFFGNSLTAGYGLDPPEAFPALIQGRIDSLKLPYAVINAGISGETSSGGLSRIDWILQQPLSVFVLELGGNDGLRGIPVAETTKNLQAIIDKVRQKYPDAKIILAGMQVPPNMGSTYSTQFRSMFRNLVEKNKTLLIPFLLEGVGGVPELNQGDGIHPNAQGEKIVAENVWAVIKNTL
ncbi:MAG TPA: arylesterase [Puia sp.]|nr:arylesterase [Puia sp.]